MDILFILTALLMLLFAICVAVIFNTKIVYSIPFTFALFGLVIYFAFITGIGNFSLLVCGVVLIVPIAVCVYRRYSINEYRQVMSSWGFFVFGGTVLVLSFLYRDYPLVGGDDYSYWAAAVKHMYFNGTPTCMPDANISARDYIMGIPCVEYLFVKLHPEWSDDVLHRGYCLWILSLGLPLFANISFERNVKNTGKIIFCIVLMIIFPFLFFNAAYAQVNSDPIIVMGIACTFAGLLLIESKSNFYRIWLTVMCMSVTGFKFGSLGFAGAFILFAAVNEICRKQSLKNVVRNAIVSGAGCVAVYEGWSLCMKHSNTLILWSFESVGMGSPFKRVLGIITGKGAEVQYTIINKFIRSFFGLESLLYYGKPQISNIFWLLIVCICFVLLSFFLGRKQTILFFIVYMISLLAYMAGLLYAYLFQFNDSMTVFSGNTEELIPSYPRYTIYWIGGILIGLIIYLINQNPTECDKSKAICYHSVAVGLSLLLLLNLKTVFEYGIFRAPWVYTKEWARSIRDDCLDIVRAASDMGENDRVWIISKDGAGYLYTRYYLTPISCNWDYTDIVNGRLAYLVGDGYKEGTEYYSVDEWHDYLKDYTYLYIFNLPDGFEDTYGNCFENGVYEKSFYIINYEESDLSFSKYFYE